VEFRGVVFVVKSGKFKGEVIIRMCAWTETETEREHGNLINQSYFLKKIRNQTMPLKKC
jgi:hypothetical protein